MTEARHRNTRATPRRMTICCYSVYPIVMVIVEPDGALP